MENKSRLVSGFIIGTFVTLYLMVSVISTIHVIDFFKLSNPDWLAISLAIAFEVGAAASLALSTVSFMISLALFPISSADSLADPNRFLKNDPSPMMFFCWLTIKFTKKRVGFVFSPLNL